MTQTHSYLSPLRFQCICGEAAWCGTFLGQGLGFVQFDLQVLHVLSAVCCLAQNPIGFLFQVAVVLNRKCHHTLLQQRKRQMQKIHSEQSRLLEERAETRGGEMQVSVTPPHQKKRGESILIATQITVRRRCWCCECVEKRAKQVGINMTHCKS